MRRSALTLDRWRLQFGVGWYAVRVVTRTKRRCRDASRSRGSSLVPALSFPGSLPTLGVGKQPAVDHIRQLPFQRAHRLATTFALGEFAQVVVTASSAVADLGDGGQVDDLIDLAVAVTVVPMADDVTGGSVQRRGAVERGKIPRVGNRRTSPTIATIVAEPMSPMP
jgi:hypothetical protein